MSKKPDTFDKIYTLENYVSEISEHIKELDDNNIRLEKPDPHAGYVAVDPVVLACLSFKWGKLKANLKRITGKEKTDYGELPSALKQK